MDIISIQKFSNFIIKALDKASQPNSVASFAFTPEGTLSISELGVIIKEYEKSFYWEKPEEGIIFVGLGELHYVSESGIGRFAITEKKIRLFQDSFINNWDEFNEVKFPLFVGGMKFSSENEKEIWDNYPDSNWFIPHFMITRQAGEIKILYNFLISPSSSKEKLERDFEYKLAQVIKLTAKPEQPAIRPSVILRAGNGSKDKKKWMESVKKAIEIIESDKVKKVVLSRKVELELNREPDLTSIIKDFRQKYPGCYLFMFHSGKSTFFGASPEKLIKLDNGWIEADALAGSAPRGQNDAEDKELEEKLLNSEKDNNEHNAVKEYLVKLFSSISDEVHYEQSPRIKKIKNIQHLWTPIKAKLKPMQKIFSILENLHPTPAVCGVPKSEAMHIIKRLEEYPRGLYAGILGWFNFNGEGEFTVSIRSALIKGKKLYIFAGGGIVEGSDPANEFKETELKLNPILSLFESENTNK
ncbi:MAG: isochorismate synthase [Bacillota bacterium]